MSPVPMSGPPTNEDEPMRWEEPEPVLVPKHNHEFDGTVEGCPACFHDPRTDPKFDNEVNEVAPMPLAYRAAHEFLSTMFGPDGYPPDAVGQLVEVFLPCLEIMVDHNWGELWRGAGLQSIMDQMKSKFDRYWERTWVKGERHADSGFDLINLTGFTLRSDPDNIWGNRGKPAWAGEEES